MYIAARVGLGKHRGGLTVLTELYYHTRPIPQLGTVADHDASRATAASRRFASRLDHAITSRVAREMSIEEHYVLHRSFRSVDERARWRARWSTWALTPVPGRTAERLQSHHTASANQGIHGHCLDGRYSPRPSSGVPSRPTSLACMALSGRPPLLSQYLSFVPIRSLLNASRADMHWLAALAGPFGRVHSLVCPLCAVLREAGWLHEALTAKSRIP